THHFIKETESILEQEIVDLLRATKVNILFDEVKENAITLDDVGIKQRLLISAMRIRNVFDDKISKLSIYLVVIIPTTGVYHNN
ncbi:26679_t:CDS:2, partial [Racocetra persica]